ncbi:receptor-type tyrosine-protein phosphatase F-like isoform X2 [Osmerus eperlanus]|uniref:receptor-type tyrosine-protein phosphatase F-like isoform X2 n=1 Tax=Osmerus eperlanus TaxID=29151 RepID=UPI002E16588C
MVPNIQPPVPLQHRGAAPVMLLLLCCMVVCSHADSTLSFVKTPEDQTGISGSVASFVCQATGEPKPRITWMKKGKKVSSQRFEVIDFDDSSGSVLRIQPLRTHRDEAIYECTATNSAGEINTSAKLTVLEENQTPHGFPTIDVGPQLKVVEKTRTAIMLCAASGNPDPEISWFKDFLPVDINSSNGRIKQLRSGALQIENSEEMDQGKYECVAMNSAGTRYSAPANLYVRMSLLRRYVPPRFSITPTNREVMPGGSVNLTCVAVGSPMPYVKWMMGQVELTEEEEMPVGRNVLEVTNIRESANYTCVALSSLGMIEATVQVTVKGRGPPSDPVETRTGEQAPSSPPLAVQALMLSASTMLVLWEPPEEPNGQIRGYRVYYTSDMDAPLSAWQKHNTGNSRHTLISSLTTDIIYSLRVLGFTSVGDGPPSDVLQVKTQEGVRRRVPPRFLIPPTNREVMPGGSVNLTCVAVGSPMPYVKWMMGQVELTEEEEIPMPFNVLEVTNIRESANYTCVAISSLGMIEATVQVTVKALPKPPASLIVTETTATSAWP